MLYFDCFHELIYHTQNRSCFRSTFTAKCILVLTHKNRLWKWHLELCAFQVISNLKSQLFICAIPRWISARCARTIFFSDLLVPRRTYMTVFPFARPYAAMFRFRGICECWHHLYVTGPLDFHLVIQVLLSPCLIFQHAYTD